jgi:hypothetical protein
MLMVGNTSMNQLVSKICLSRPHSQNEEEWHGHGTKYLIQWFIKFFVETGSDVRRDMQYTSVHCEKKRASIINCDYNRKKLA